MRIAFSDRFPIYEVTAPNVRTVPDGFIGYASGHIGIVEVYRREGQVRDCAVVAWRDATRLAEERKLILGATNV